MKLLVIFLGIFSKFRSYCFMPTLDINGQRRHKEEALIKTVANFDAFRIKKLFERNNIVMFVSIGKHVRNTHVDEHWELFIAKIRFLRSTKRTESYLNSTEEPRVSIPCHADITTAYRTADNRPSKSFIFELN